MMVTYWAVGFSGSGFRVSPIGSAAPSPLLLLSPPFRLREGRGVGPKLIKHGGGGEQRSGT